MVGAGITVAPLSRCCIHIHSPVQKFGSHVFSMVFFFEFVWRNFYGKNSRQAFFSTSVYAHPVNRANSLPVMFNLFQRWCKHFDLAGEQCAFLSVYLPCPMGSAKVQIAFVGWCQTGWENSDDQTLKGKSSCSKFHELPLFFSTFFPDHRLSIRPLLPPGIWTKF